MRLATQFPNQRRILTLCGYLPRHARALGVGVLIAASAGSGRSVAQGLNAEEKKTETIRGTVVNSVTHEPIGRALVYSLDNRFAMMCDAGGHFEFKIPRAKNEAETGMDPDECLITMPVALVLSDGWPDCTDGAKAGISER